MRGAVDRARTLRRTMTEVERKLWLKLREQDIGFRRQAPIGRYIVDFVSHPAKLVVELDGGQHNEPAAQTYDDVRTAWLETRGYRVLRFWNADVNENLEGVLDTIVHAVSNPSPTLPPSGGKGE
jgi:very-short-patch-repair endonuclease